MSTAHQLPGQLARLARLNMFNMQDPGNGTTFYFANANPVFWPITTGATAETRTLAAPTGGGQIVAVGMAVDGGGDCTLTVTGGMNYRGDTTVRFNGTGQWVLLISGGFGTSFTWVVVASDGVTPGNGMWAGAPSRADHRYESLVHEYFNDFRGLAADYDVTNEWTYTEVGGGGAAALVADALCGRLTLTTDALDNDACQIVLQQMSFSVALAKKIWYETKFQLVTAAKATQSDWVAGLIGAGENLVAVADSLPANGIVFHKDDGDTNIDITTSDNGANVQSLALGTFAVATDIVLGFYFDAGATGAGIITPYINGVAKTPITTAAYATMTTLSPAFMVRNGEAGAIVLSVDYVKVLQLR